MPIVVVESPAKARTIEKILGRDYQVLASYGHIRDLREKQGSVDPENGFSMTWDVDNKSRGHISAIAQALRSGQELLLATDPDREGEAISWHLQQVLGKRKGLGTTVANAKRIVFSAITKDAIKGALAEPRQVDSDLVDAYSARRALDYLVGFNISPILWKKLPGAKAAGRVQSVCLRLIVERELEIEQFNKREYWTVDALLETERRESFQARLLVLHNKKLGTYGLESKDKATQAAEAIRAADLSVRDQKSRNRMKKPPPPFTTATLQQEASRKLRFNTKRTMSGAQRLYEAGHITYMRTDAIDMAPEAVRAARQEITRRFGKGYCPANPRVFKNKAKNAQEAHECIRPTDFAGTSASLRLSDKDQSHLYELIWKRATASQMSTARFKQTQVDVGTENDSIILRATGNVMIFDGYLSVYQEGQDKKVDSHDPAKGASNKILPTMETGDAVVLKDIQPGQHFTKPKPRFTEASLIKKMVELGIGRPSTYSAIVSRIQEHGYVDRVQKARTLQPTPRGRVLNTFLMSFFTKYIEYDFTAEMERQLDDISGGRKRRNDVLEDFWRPFSRSVGSASQLKFVDVAEMLSDTIAPQVLVPVGEDQDVRLCPNCKGEKLVIKVFSGSDPFFACSGCRFRLPIQKGAKGYAGASAVLGIDPETGRNISLKNGRFGPYLELAKATKPRRKAKTVSVPKQIPTDQVDLELALKLLSLPRLVGPHPEGAGDILAGIGRNGPYLKYGSTYVNVSDPREVLTIGMNRAMELLAKGGTGRSGERMLGKHPVSGGPVKVLSGRYGPYIKHPGGNRSIPKSMDPQKLTLEQAVALIESTAGQNSRSFSSNVVQVLGVHPKKGGDVALMNGRYGPYVKWQKVNVTIPQTISDPKQTTLEQAVEMIDNKLAGKPVPGSFKVLAALGDHPDKGGSVQVLQGRYGPCVQWKRTYVTLPANISPQEVTLDQATRMIAQKSKKRK